MVKKIKLFRRLLKRYEVKQANMVEEQEENYYFRETFSLNENKENQTEEYEILEREIVPKKIKCPDCGGVTLEGLEFCDKCGGELIYRD